MSRNDDNRHQTPLTDGDRARLILASRENLDHLLANLTTTLGQLRSMRGGLSGSLTDAPVAGGDPGRPTEERAGRSTDPADRALRTIDRNLRSIGAMTYELRDIAITWTRKELGKNDPKPKTEGAAGCEVMKRYGVWEPIFRETDLGGVLNRKYHLGRWAYDFAVRYGRLPIEHECRAHIEGRKVRVKK